MLETYFGIKQMPFTQEIKTVDLIPSFDIKETEARLAYLKQHRGIMRLTGEPGSGKTSILRRWVDTLNPQAYQHCYTHMPPSLKLICTDKSTAFSTCRRRCASQICSAKSKRPFGRNTLKAESLA